jgi:hypothetical protein
MSKSAHTEAQIIGALKQVEPGRKAEEVAREVGGARRSTTSTRTESPNGRCWRPIAGGGGVRQSVSRPPR